MSIYESKQCFLCGKQGCMYGVLHVPTHQVVAYLCTDCYVIFKKKKVTDG